MFASHRFGRHAWAVSVVSLFLILALLQVASSDARRLASGSRSTSTVFDKRKISKAINDVKSLNGKGVHGQNIFQNAGRELLEYAVCFKHTGPKLGHDSWAAEFLANSGCRCESLRGCGTTSQALADVYFNLEEGQKPSPLNDAYQKNCERKDVRDQSVRNQYNEFEALLRDASHDDKALVFRVEIDLLSDGENRNFHHGFGHSFILEKPIYTGGTIKQVFLHQSYVDLFSFAEAEFDGNRVTYGLEDFLTRFSRLMSAPTVPKAAQYFSGFFFLPRSRHNYVAPSALGWATKAHLKDTKPLFDFCFASAEFDPKHLQTAVVTGLTLLQQAAAGKFDKSFVVPHTDGTGSDAGKKPSQVLHRCPNFDFWD